MPADLFDKVYLICFLFQTANERERETERRNSRLKLFNNQVYDDLKAEQTH